MKAEFPDDETGELLKLMQEQGEDLSRPRDVDFFLVFETREQAEGFASEADLGPEFTVTTGPYEKTEKWQATLTVNMTPVYAEIVKLEKQVTRLGREYGGEADGWGCAKSG